MPTPLFYQSIDVYIKSMLCYLFNLLVALTEQEKALGEEMEQRISANEKMLLASLSEADIKKLKQMLLTMYNNLE